MAELLRMPEISANMESAVLSQWTIAEGASFSAKDVIAVIETDKAIVDYEAETGGTLARILIKDGTEVAVGGALALIAAPGESIADIDATLASLGESASPMSAPAPAAAAVEASRLSSTAVAEEVVVAAVEASGSRTFSSPLARKLAREAGLDVAAIQGTGPGGRIVRRDVLAAVSAGPAQPAAATAAVPSTAAAAPASVTDVPHTRLRKAIAARLTESKTTAPHFYVRGTANVDKLLRMREQINDGATTRISVNDLLIKAMAKAHLAVPALNVEWRTDAIRHFASVDIAVAVATEKGLVTPVLRGVEAMTVTQVATTVRDYAERARAGRIQQHELEGGSTSISNLGMYGTEEFAAIINPPQASILAVGATRKAPIVKNDEVVVANVLTVTLSVDHRPVDGVDAAQWMQAFIALLERPAQILA